MSRGIKSDVGAAKSISSSMKVVTEQLLDMEADIQLATNTNVSGNTNAKQSITRMGQCASDFSSMFTRDSDKITALAEDFEEVEESYHNRITFGWD